MVQLTLALLPAITSSSKAGMVVEGLAEGVAGLEAIRTTVRAQAGVLQAGVRVGTSKVEEVLAGAEAGGPKCQGQTVGRWTGPGFSKSRFWRTPGSH